MAAVAISWLYQGGKVSHFLDVLYSYAHSNFIFLVKNHNCEIDIRGLKLVTLLMCGLVE